VVAQVDGVSVLGTCRVALTVRTHAVEESSSTHDTKSLLYCALLQVTRMQGMSNGFATITLTRSLIEVDDES
jgi:hypothetical protein